MSNRLQGAHKNENTSALYARSKKEMYLSLYHDFLKFATEWGRLLSNVSVYMSNNELRTDASKLNVILNLRCLPECIPLCCEYANTIYKKRESYLIWEVFWFFRPSYEYIHVYILHVNYRFAFNVLINHILHETRFIVVPCNCIFPVLFLCMCVFRYLCSYVIAKTKFNVKVCQ